MSWTPASPGQELTCGRSGSPPALWPPDRLTYYDPAGWQSRVNTCGIGSLATRVPAKVQPQHPHAAVRIGEGPNLVEPPSPSVTAAYDPVVMRATLQQYLV